MIGRVEYADIDEVNKPNEMYNIDDSSKFTHVRQGKEAWICQMSEFNAGCYVGNYSYIGAFTKVFDNTIIKNYVSIANGCSIGAGGHPTHWLSTHHFQGEEDTKYYLDMVGFNVNTFIEDDVWIGSNVVIMRGVTIGAGAIIGGGAIITKSVEPYSIMVGVPGKLMRYRFDEATRDKLMDLKWWELDKELLRDVKFDDIDKAIAQVKAIKEKI